MRKKVALVTGATSGIGLETVRSLARKEYVVVMACRDMDKGACLVADFISEDENAEVHLLPVDMASLHSVRAFVELFNTKYQKLDVLVNNAGAFFDRLQKTEDGFEMTMGVNYLAPFLLTRLLLPSLKNTAEARIVNITSKAAFYAKLKPHGTIFSNNTYGFKAYAASKLAQILFTIDLAEELKDMDVTVNSAYPGRVATNIWKGNSLLMKIVAPIMTRKSISAAEGAKTGVYLASSPVVKGISGKLFYNEAIMDYNQTCLDEWLRKKVMQLSFDAVNVPIN